LTTKAPSPTAEAKEKSKPKGRPARARLVLAGAALLCILGLVVYFILAARTEALSGVVKEVRWTRSVEIEGLVPVEREAWRDEVPDQALVGTCRQELRYTSDEPEPNSQEVCGTPYTVDTGSGFGEVVQDCVYEVYDDICTYTVEAWQAVDTVTLSGQNLNPRWPEPTLTENQRLGQEDEKFTVIFQTDEGELTYSPPDAGTFSQFQPGSRWILEVNTFNTVVSVEPAR
jgi:hypothetical protein